MLFYILLWVQRYVSILNPVGTRIYTISGVPKFSRRNSSLGKNCYEASKVYKYLFYALPFKVFSFIKYLHELPNAITLTL